MSLGIALGPTVGGLLIAVAGWRTIFLVNVPIGIFACLVVVRSIPAGVRQPGKQQFDWFGAVLMTVILIAFALGMTHGQDQGFTNPVTLGLLAIAAVGLISFLWIETRLAQPMLDLHLFRDLQFSLSLLTGLLVFITIAGLIFIIPFFLELVLHYTTQHVGLLLAVSPVLGGIIAPLSGNLSDRFGTRAISLVGLLLMVLGCFAISTLDARMTDLDYILRVAPFGIGFGMFQSPNNSAILGAVPPDRLGIASGLLSLSRTLGQTTGVPLLGSLFTFFTLAKSEAKSVITAPPEALVIGLQDLFRLAAISLLLASAIVFFLWQSKPSKVA